MKLTSARLVLSMLAALAIMTFGLASGIVPGPQVAVAQTDACSTANIAAAMRREAKSIGGAESRDLAAWCRKQEQAERTASLAARPGGGATTTKGAVNLKAAEKDSGTAIICGKNACGCWKGKYWNGCQHISSLCKSDLHCVGSVCGCQAK
jgi:hypothetical protein